MRKLLCIFILITASLQAVEQKSAHTLSGDVRALLSQEMQQIEKGMKDIFSHMVRGEYKEINTIALKIRDSFILRKKLTKEQKEELRKLPKSFFALDQSFHEAAGDLANAAEFGDKNTVVEYYQKMAAKCVACHSTYATHRFSNFEE